MLKNFRKKMFSAVCKNMVKGALTVGVLGASINPGFAMSPNNISEKQNPSPINIVSNIPNPQQGQAPIQPGSNISNFQTPIGQQYTIYAPTQPGPTTQPLTPNPQYNTGSGYVPQSQTIISTPQFQNAIIKANALYELTNVLQELKRNPQNSLLTLSTFFMQYQTPGILQSILETKNNLLGPWVIYALSNTQDFFNLYNKNQTLTKEKEELQKKLDENNKANTEQSNQIQNLKNTLTEKENTINSLTEANNDLTVIIKEKRKKIAKLEANSKDAEIEMLTYNIKRQNMTIEEQKDKITKLDSEVKNKNNEIKDLTLELEELKTFNEEWQAQCTKLREKNSSMEEKLNTQIQEKEKMEIAYLEKIRQLEEELAKSRPQDNNDTFILPSTEPAPDATNTTANNDATSSTTYGKDAKRPDDTEPHNNNTLF